jgi:PAS domain S-box-containing protein
MKKEDDVKAKLLIQMEEWLTSLNSENASLLLSRIKHVKNFSELLLSNVNLSRTLFENNPAYIVLINQDGRVIDMNNAMLNALGYTAEEVYDKPYLETFVPEEDHEMLRDIFSSLTDKHKETVNQNYIVGKDGSRRLVGWHGNVIFDADHMFKYFFGIGIDITDRHKTEQESSLLRNYLSNMINFMPSVVIGIDKDFRVTHWNEKAEEKTGVACSGAVGKRIADVFPQINNKMDLLSKSIYGGCVRSEELESRNTADGIVYETTTIYPLNSDGVDGAVIRVDDVTKEYLLQERLNQKHKMDVIGQLAGGVAHDFNNMLCGIVSAAQMLKVNGITDEKRIKYADMILKASARATSLTTKLLAFGRKGNVVLKPVDIHAVIDDAVALLEKSINRKSGFVIHEDADNSLVIGDDSMLQNAIMNICINASHAMPNGGEILIRTDNVALDNAYCKNCSFEIAPGNYIHVDIEDSGSGIPAENLSNIFEPFYTTKANGKGVGLGLSAVYGTVQEHHGAIAVKSKLGVGTVFTMYLPVAGEQVEDDQLEAVVTHGYGRILFVDDEEIIRLVSKEAMEEMGYNVLVAASGMEAIDILKKQSVDLVILDMIMPGMDGKETFHMIREIDANCKVIISSGFTKPDHLDELTECGISGFLRKPYQKAELSQLLADVLGD